MTQEQKAKAYDEALEQARRFHKAFVSGYNYPAADIKASYEAIFPELKMSDDKKIREELISFFSDLPDTDTFRGIPPSKVIAWLEKQGEQKESYDTCVSASLNDKKTPYSEKRDFEYFKKQSEKMPIGEVEPKFKVGGLDCKWL